MQDQRFLNVAIRPNVLKRALIVGLVIGTLLNLINQGDALLGRSPIIMWKLLLTYAVPYMVSTYGAVTALRQIGSDY